MNDRPQPAGRAGGPVLTWADGRPIEAPPENEPVTVRVAGGALVRQFGLDDEPYEPPEAEGDADPERLWGMRPEFKVIHQYARARRVGPWAVLSNVLARVVAATPATVVLPPTIGSQASLNLFVGLVGRSGQGKDASRSVAEEVLTINGGAGYISAPLGSGEGLSHMFMTLRKPRGLDGKPIRDADPELHQYNHAALVTVGEIDTLGALVGRRASTVMAQLRQAAMGEELGFFYVDTTKRMIVPKHAYRLCLVAGIQPERAAVLLDDADGGTPQRFVWTPVVDAEAPRHPAPAPKPLAWSRPDLGGLAPGARHEVKVCDQAIEEVLDAHHAKITGAGDPLRSHALLTQLKVGAAFGLLDGRIEVSDTDWEIAGVVMEMSDVTRLRVAGVLTEAKRRDNEAAAEAEAARASILRTKQDTETLRRVAQVVKRALARLGDDEWITGGKLSTRVAGRDREYLDAAIQGLVDVGEIEADEHEYHGQEIMRYRLRR